VIAHDLAGWKTQIAAKANLGGANYADELLAAADTAEMDAIRARQAANRHRAYERSRPTRYAAACYGGLRPEQDPRGLVSSWWDRGPRTLVLAGPPRTGKTWAAYAIANTVHANHHWVVATPAADLSAALKPDGDAAAYERAASCGLLVLDDLGRERATEWWLEQLGRLIDDRCANLRRLVVTTNATPSVQAIYDELRDRYGDPITERIFDGGGIVALDGPALREVVTSW
jgi:DNA replication protein DnaC